MCDAAAVIEIAVGHEQAVKVSDATAPEERLDHLLGDAAAAPPGHTGVVQQRVVMRPDDRREPLSDVEHPRIEAVRRRRRGTPEHDGDDPDPCDAASREPPR